MEHEGFVTLVYKQIPNFYAKMLKYVDRLDETLFTKLKSFQKVDRFR